GGEIHRDRRAEAAGADAEHLRGLQPLLPFEADLRKNQVAAVALDFVFGEFRKLTVRLKADTTDVGGARRAAGDRRNDADGVSGLDRRLFLLQIPDVFVVNVDVDEAAQLALVVV